MDKIQIASERGYFVTKDGLVFFNGKQRKLNLKNKKNINIIVLILELTVNQNELKCIDYKPIKNSEIRFLKKV